MKSEIIQVLTKARDLIKNEVNWCQEAYCVYRGHWTSYCAVGSIHQNLNIYQLTLTNERKKLEKRYIKIMNHVANMMGYSCIFELNDTSNHATVITAFNLAIQFIQDGIITV